MIRKEFKKTWWLSNALSAPIFPIYVTLAFSYFARSGSLGELQSACIGIFFLSVFCLAPIIVSALRGHTDFDVFKRKKRSIFYAIAIVGYIISFAIFAYFNNHSMAAISLAYITVTTSLGIINIWWKISAHAAGVAGPLTGIVYVFGVSFAWLYLIVPLVIYLRYRLGAHDLAQLIAGAAVAVVVTLLTYLAYY